MRAVILGGVLLCSLATMALFWKPLFDAECQMRAAACRLLGAESAGANQSNVILRDQKAGSWVEVPKAVRVDASQEALIRIWQCLEAWEYNAPDLWCTTEVSSQYLALGKAYGLERGGSL
jgi:hypothetical protein